MRVVRSPLVAVLITLGAGLPGCRTTKVAPGPPADELTRIERTLDTLYRSFCFDAGDEADWSTMRSLFLDGASFVAPVRAGRRPQAVQGDEFIEEFQDWIASSNEGETGLHERIEHLRIDVFGSVAHAYVLFEGFVPGEAQTKTRGIDSIQLVHDGERWRVASFTTQYASEDRPVPARFEAAGRPPVSER